MLSGLTAPVRISVVLAVLTIVGLGTLCQAGVLAPQLGGPEESGATSQSAQDGSERVIDAQWIVRRNIGWRTWQVTAIDSSDLGGDKAVAFVKPAEVDPSASDDGFLAAARTPALTALPLKLAPGDDLVVVRVTEATPPCAGRSSSGPPRVPGHARVALATPLGRRWIDADLSKPRTRCDPAGP